MTHHINVILLFPFMFPHYNRENIMKNICQINVFLDSKI